MDWNDTLAFYLVIGLSIAVAADLAARSSRGTRRVIHFALAWVFWPIHVPILLAGEGHAEDPEEPRSWRPLDTRLTTALERVEGELQEAIEALDPWACEVLAKERPRLEELRRVWRSQVQRVAEMDRVLASAERDLADEEVVQVSPRRSRRDRARQEHLTTLKSIREKTREELLESFAWVRELVSLLHLARFTGEPVQRAGELLSQIASCVEALTEKAASSAAGSPSS